MKYKPLLTFVILIALFVFLSFSNSHKAFSSTNQPTGKPFSLTVIENSPSNFEVINGSALYTAAINAISPQAKQFAQQHNNIARNAINKIDNLTTSLRKTRYLNQQYISNLGYQLYYWKQFTAKDPALNVYLNEEIKLFNLALQQQLQEDTKWAVIDSVYIELDSLNKTETLPANYSLSKSMLYTTLINQYVDLLAFYKTKYNKIIVSTTLFHALEENPNAHLNQQIVRTLNPYHQYEYKLAHSLVYDLDKNFKIVESVGYDAKELNALYHQIDKYCLNELDKQIGYFDQLQQYSIKNPVVIEDIDTTELLDDYISLTKTYKDSLEDKILAYEIEEAVLLTHYSNELDKIAYTGILHPELSYSGFGDFASSTWNVIKTGVKVTAGAPFAIADYVTGKASETIMEVTDKTSAMIAHGGPFSKEYQQFADTYDKTGTGVVSIQKTFVDPMKASLQGNDKQGLGQSGASKATGSFQSLEKKVDQVTGSNFTSQLALNLVTFSGYGFAKDFSTLNDANKSTADKIGATAGLVLSVVPVSTIADTTNKVLKKTFKTFTNKVSNASSKIMNAFVKNQSAKSTLGNAVSQVNKYTKQFVTISSKASKGNEMSQLLLNKASNDMSNAISQKTIAQTIYQKTSQNLTNTVKNSLVSVPANTIKNGVSTGLSAFIKENSVKSFVDKLTNLYVKNLPQAIKASTPFFGSTIGKTLGSKDVANFLLSSAINTSFNAQIANTIKNVANSTTVPPVNMANAGNASNKPSQITPQQMLVPIVPSVQQNSNTGYIQQQPQPPSGYQNQPNQINPNVAQYLQSQNQTINKVNTHIMKVLTQNQQQLQQQKQQLQQQKPVNQNNNQNMNQNFNTAMTPNTHVQNLSNQTQQQTQTIPQVNQPGFVPSQNTPQNNQTGNIISQPNQPVSTQSIPQGGQNSSSSSTQTPAGCGQTGKMFDCKCNPNASWCQGSSNTTASTTPATTQPQQQNQSANPNIKYKYPRCNPNYLYGVEAASEKFSLKGPSYPPSNVSISKTVQNDIYRQWAEKKKMYEETLAWCRSMGYYHEEGVGSAYKAKVLQQGGQY